MKIAREFARDCQPRWFAEVIAALQPDLQFTALCFGNRRQHASWSNRNELRRRVVDQYRAAAGIARVEVRTVDDHLATGDCVDGIDPYDFGAITHKSRSSY